MLSIAFAGKGQHQDAGGKITHAAPNTTSVITSKSISKDGGRSSYRGLLQVNKGAVGAPSKVVCDALIIDDESRTDTYPYINIDENDVEIGHEATVSKIGEEQLFYLMSRGLSEEEASGDDRLRVRRADHQGAAARVRGRAEPADPAADGGLGRMTQTVSEPAWLAGRRAAARERYEALPVPTNREEAWRYTNLRGFDPDAFDAAAVGADAERGRAARRGCAFGSLAHAVAERPELVERALRHGGGGRREVRRRERRPSWTDGVFLHVPPASRSTVPLRASVERAGRGRGACFYRALVVLERGARATFAEEYSSAAPGYVNTVVELVVGDGARLEYVTTQRHHAETRQFGTHRATIGRDAEVDWVVLGLGGTRAKSRIESYLADQGANAKVTGAYFLTRLRARGLRHHPGARGAEHDRPTCSSRACWPTARGPCGVA